MTPLKSNHDFAIVHIGHCSTRYTCWRLSILSYFNNCAESLYSSAFLGCFSLPKQHTKHFLRLPTCLQQDKVFHLHNALHSFFFFFWQWYPFSSISWWFSVHSIDIKDFTYIKDFSFKLKFYCFSQASTLSLRGFRRY